MIIEGRIKELLYQIFEEKQVTTKTQKIWNSSLQFYVAINDFCNANLVEPKMIDNRTKKWVLTKSGKKAVMILHQIDMLEKQMEEEINHVRKV